MPRPRDSRFLASLASITLIGPLAIHLFLPVMPEVRVAFGISDALAGLTFSISLFVTAFITLVYGSLSDRYGRRPVLLAGLLLFGIGSAVSAIAGSVSSLIAGRMIQALGAGCGVSLARTIARDAYGTDGLVRIIAYLTMAYTLGPMVAPLIAGILLDSCGWRSVFLFAMIAGAIIAAAAYFVLYETRPADLTDLGSVSILRNYVALLSRPNFTAFVLQTGFSSGTFFAMAAASSFLMKDYLGRSATEFGFFFMFYPAGYFLGTVLSSGLSQRISIENAVILGSAIIAVTIAFQSGLILGGYLNPLIIFVPGFLISFAQGIALPNAQVGAIRVIPGLAGTAAGIGVFFQMFLGAVFSQAYGLLADGTPLPMVITVSSGAALTLIAGVTPYLLKRQAGSASRRP